jgi:tRNA/rRNA methyltransferase/tRNA (cytidine32/uridine32-2'-O)-methyltransferase
MSGLKNIVVVLYQPQDIVNVGGVVRVMSNFGLRRLRLVEPAAYDPYRIEGIAHHTEKIVAGIERYATLEEALADCGFVLGTTARKRGTRREHLTPHQSAPYLLDYATAHSEAPAALLFGREDDGLPNEALDLCHALVTIPTDTANRSLNLAQAALVLAYELWITASAKSEVRSQKPEVIEDRGQGTGDREIQSIPTESSSSSFIPHPSENSPDPTPPNRAPN